jgi:hypothetical protein
MKLPELGLAFFEKMLYHNGVERPGAPLTRAFDV